MSNRMGYEQHVYDLKVAIGMWEVHRDRYTITNLVRNVSRGEHDLLFVVAIISLRVTKSVVRTLLQSESTGKQTCRRVDPVLCGEQLDQTGGSITCCRQHNGRDRGFHLIGMRFDFLVSCHCLTIRSCNSFDSPVLVHSLVIIQFFIPPFGSHFYRCPAVSPT